MSDIKYSAVKYNKGFSMIEILVALVILAIGLLGMATLMMNSLQTSQSAAMRSAATQAVYDLTERMRSNADAAEQGKYSTGVVKDIKDLTGGAPSSGQCAGSAKALAECDTAVWAKAWDKVLPGAKVIVAQEGSISVNGTQQKRLWCIGIFWKDSGGKDVADGNKKVCGASNPGDTDNPWVYYEAKVLL